ncbi:MAG: 4-hydroxyphenylacetate decarboxylase small subunit [Candidatus Bathyarchaeia archaeon]
MLTQLQVSKCGDCDYFTPVDVFKGICHLNKRSVLTDENACTECVPTKKCKFCANYTSKTDALGLCKGITVTFPELRTRTCEIFEWKSEPKTRHDRE